MILLMYANLINQTFRLFSTLQEARFSPKFFTRKRKMPFEMLLRFLLSGRKAAAQAALDEFFQKSGDEIHMSQQALSKARNHFDHTPFTKAFYNTLASEYNLEDDLKLKRFRGYKIFAIDGSTIPLPNIPELRKKFGTIGAGATSPSARASITYDVINDRIVEADIVPMTTDERTLAHDHIYKLDNRIIMEDSLFVFDRGYASKELIRQIQGQHAHFLMRTRRKFNLAVDAAPMGSSIVMLEDDLRVRVVKFLLSSGETETLITDLYDLEEEAFPELYFLRWPVECKYDIVKNKLELPNFTGWSCNIIRQDFWISMLLANTAAAAKTDADQRIRQEREGKPNKYEYQANVNTIIATLRSRFADAVFDEVPIRRMLRINVIIAEVARSVVPKRPNRIVPRNKNNRKTKYHHNKKSNV